jgi:hypothetical protein
MRVQKTQLLAALSASASTENTSAQNASTAGRRRKGDSSLTFQAHVSKRCVICSRLSLRVAARELLASSSSR